VNGCNAAPAAYAFQILLLLQEYEQHSYITELWKHYVNTFFNILYYSQNKKHQNTLTPGTRTSSRPTPSKTSPKVSQPTTIPYFL